MKQLYFQSTKLQLKDYYFLSFIGMTVSIWAPGAPAWSGLIFSGLSSFNKGMGWAYFLKIIYPLPELNLPCEKVILKVIYK